MGPAFTRRGATSGRFIVIACLLLAHAAMGGENRTVLVLYSGNRLVPGYVAVDRGLRETLSKLDDQPVQVFSEFLDRPDFGGEAYEQTESRYLREKYAARPPAAIVAVSDHALRFLLRKRAEIFPGVPIVHVAMTKTSLEPVLPLPPDVVGVPIAYDFAGTIEQALRWHPRVARLIIVTGASDRDREWEARLRRDLPRVAGNIDVEYLTGLPAVALRQRLGQFGADAVVFTPGFYQDGAGRLFNPRDAASLVAEASTAPVYGSFDTFIGTGVVGGWMPSFEAAGRQAGNIVNAIVTGVMPANVRLPEAEPAALRVDWRQVRKWGIDEAAIPADTVVSFRQPTFWEMYRGEAISVALIFLMQMALIAALLLERRRRRTAQLAVQKQRTELAHASRLAVAGELTASIAHEINQPLGAILTNADAAELLLQSGTDRLDDVRRILARIRADDLRASEVIRRLRTLLAKHEFERRPIRLAELLADVAELLRTEARQRRIALEWPAAVPAAAIVGDSVQIQQVIINLVLNAMDAVAEVPEAARIVTVSVAQNANGVLVTVRDRGPGIGPENIGKLFESFFTTKTRGMGLGLSIARTIVEAHGGRIWADDRLQEGAQFHVQLPVLQPSPVVA